MNDFEVIHEAETPAVEEKSGLSPIGKVAVILGIVGLSAVVLSVVVYLISLAVSLFSLIPFLGAIFLIIEPIKDLIAFPVCIGLCIIAALTGGVGLALSIVARKNADEAAKKKLTLAMVFSIIAVVLGILGVVGYVVIAGIELVIYIIDFIVGFFTGFMI